jgi:multicomponent Na+:H+ antiporter subunit G
MTSLNDLAPYVADFLVILGCFILTAGLVGLIKMPDIYTKIHAASKAVFLGAIVIMGASIATRDLDIILRVVLIAIALILTTPVASHVIAQSAAREHELMESEGAFDESDYHLAPADHVPEASHPPT